MNVSGFRLLAAFAIGTTLLAGGGCTRLRTHQGYIIDVDLVNAIQPGVDNRTSVLATLGTPTLNDQFAGGDWVYLARDSRNFAFQNPRASDQTTIRISFDKAGNVAAVRRSGLTQSASIEPYGKTTPTLGRKRGFFEDLFGNIGTVGAPGAGGGAGGRDQP